MALPPSAPSRASRSASLRPIMPAPPMMRMFIMRLLGYVGCAQPTRQGPRPATVRNANARICAKAQLLRTIVRLDSCNGLKSLHRFKTKSRIACMFALAALDASNELVCGASEQGGTRQGRLRQHACTIIRDEAVRALL